MYFTRKDVFIKKLSIFSLLCLAYVFAIWGFGSYGIKYKSYKFYYAKAYVAAGGFMANNLLVSGKNLLTGLFKQPTNVEAATSSVYAESVPVLLYHGILDKTDGVNVSLSDFEDQMFALKSAGYQTVSIDDFYAFMQGAKQLPKKSFLLTFDDGRKDSYYPANPIIRALGYNAVMFAIADFSSMNNSDYYLSKSEIQSLAKNPRWVIESHTRTHRNLAEVPEAELPDEIVGSKKILENIVGKPIIAFAFPFGELGQETADQSGTSDQSKKEIMKMAVGIYKMSFFQFLTIERFTQNYVGADKQQSQNYLIKRIEPQPGLSGKDLLIKLQNGTAKPLPFAASLTSSDGWINTLWGDLTLGNNVLSLNALNNTSGSATILDGSRKWQNYQFNAHIISSPGTNVYLWARYQDDDNYVACNFGDNLAHVEQTLEGKIDVVKGNNIPTLQDLKTKGFDASIKVDGRNVSCLVNGQVVSETNYLSPTLETGGIGIKVWNRVLGTAKINATEISVEGL